MAPRPLLASIIPAALWLSVVLTGGLAIFGTRPPRGVGHDASETVFSAERAMTHLAHIASHPHPIGSEEGVRVREYLVEQLRGLGGDVHVEQGIGTVQYARNLHSGLVNNIVATFPGQATSRPIMLVAHYDSVPAGPGAADDGAGLIVILEAIRALRAGPPINNDLVVLFTDGEEARGLLGAQAYATNHPELKDRIGTMVNLEARGGSGPGLMFETSDNNGALIREFARAAPYPMATSLMAAIYKLLPNNTDFTPLKTAGLAGVNFAFLETYQSYHTRLDTTENLDARSVQHLGANALGIIRHFGNLALPQRTEPDLVYFNWFGSQLLVYPVWFAWTVALLAPILFAIGCIRAARFLELSLGRTVWGLGSFFVQLLIVIGGSFAAFAASKWIAGELLEGDPVSNRFLLAGIVGIAFGLAMASQRLLGNKLGIANLAAGQLLAVSLLTLILCWFLVGGTYVFQWPLVAGMAGMLVGRRFTEPMRSVCYFGFLIPALLILVPLAYMFFVSLLLSYLGLAAVALLLTGLIAIAPPLCDRLAGRTRLSLFAIFFVSACLIGAGIRLSRWSALHPRPDTLIYSLNTDENKAKWVSYDTAPDAWTGRILGPAARKQSEPAYTIGLERPVLASDATLLPMAAPVVAITQNSALDGERTMKLQVTSKRGARSLVVRLPSEIRPTAAGWAGKVETIHDNSSTKVPWTFRFYNAPDEGVSFEFRCRAQQPIRVWVADSTPGLPPVERFSQRPDDTVPGYGSDVTVVTRSLEL
jgi:Peptidase family M28